MATTQKPSPGLPPLTRPKSIAPSPSTNSTVSIYSETDASRALQRAAGDFTTWKIREGLVVSAAMTPSTITDTNLPPEVQMALTQQMPVSTIAYAFVRRFAQRKGNECVMVLLEDITQYERITAIGSRLKWAKAICASVQAEIGKNSVMTMLFTSSLSAQGIATSPPPSPGTNAVGFPGRPSETLNVSQAWAAICTQVNNATAHTTSAGVYVGLPDGLFMPVFRAVSRAVAREIMPCFTGSQEHKALLLLARSLAQLLAGNGTLLPGPVAALYLDPAVTMAQLSRQPLRTDFFERLGVIGSGSYGSVYAWRLKLSGQLYAVKVCDKKILKSKNSVHTVVRELACSLAADSPFITTPSFSFHDSESLYIGLPFLEKGDLERWLLAQPLKRFDESTARWYTAQLVLALRRMHQAGIIHRDLKASNLLVDRNGYIQLSDFGLSVFAHRCSKVSPDYARPCWGEKSEQALGACCLGCSLCSKLKALQVAAEENEKRGMTPLEAGQAAAESMHMPGARGLEGGSSKTMGEGVSGGSGTSGRPRAYSRGSASRLSRDSRDSARDSSRIDPAGDSDMSVGGAAPGPAYGAGAGAMPTSMSTDEVPGSTSGKKGSQGRASGFFRMFGSKVAGADGAGKPVGGMTSAHAIASMSEKAEGKYSSAPMANVDGKMMDADDPMGQDCTTPNLIASAPGSGHASVPCLNMGAACGLSRGSEREFEDSLSPTAVMRQAPHARVPLEDGYVNGTVLVLQDCACKADQDDGTSQWYRGRAGTSAYWSPQMLIRDSQNERCAYSYETDFWSLGCLTYALMTGRSPFASGMGSAYDNSLTVEGRITWPKGVFSANAKTFISSLCTVDPDKRLGYGKGGWAAVMRHPWFTSGPNPIDWDLLEQRVLQPLSIPSYSVSLSWTKVPDKIANQDKGAAAEEAAAADAAAKAAAASAVLSAEDHAIFSACTFTHPHMWRRALLLRAFGMTGITGEELYVEPGVMGKSSPGALKTPPRDNRVTTTGKR